MALYHSTSRRFVGSSWKAPTMGPPPSITQQVTALIHGNHVHDTRRVGKGNLPLNLSQNRTWQSPVIRLFLFNQRSFRSLQPNGQIASVLLSWSCLSISLAPIFIVQNIYKLNKSTPSFHFHYRSFNTTTSWSAPTCGIGIQPRGCCHLCLSL